MTPGPAALRMADLHARCFTRPPPWSATAFAGMLAMPEVYAVDRPAGFALGRVIAGEAELLTIAVEPALRRAGHGRAILTAATDAATARGAVRIFLEVAADNAAACALYAAAGFAQTGRRRGYYRAPGLPPVDALILSRRLTGG